MNEIIFDLEGDGLTPTKIYCLSYEENNTVRTLTDYQDMRNLLSRTDCVFIGHNIIGFDLPTLERLLKIDLSGIRKIDTLPVSWYLRPAEKRHGLAVWGERLGIAKPEIEDWFTLSLKEYIHRCEEDVRITRALWNLFKRELLAIYGKSEAVNEFIGYLNFKMKCLHLANVYKWRLDVEKCKKGIDILSKIADNKVSALEKVMPKVPVYAKRTEPKVMYKKDGTLSAAGLRWTELKKEYKQEKDGSILELVDYNEPNPNSHDQIKAWLKSLGWVPCTFKTNKKKKEVPQITVIGGPELTPSVELLAEKEPAVLELAGLFTVNHRLSILEGFLKNQEDGYLVARASGLTNTLRLKHSELVNLPAVGSEYGEYIRPCLIAPEGYEVCGADMSSLEDSTKKHYIYPYDPEYVEEMNKEGFDPHLDIASLGGMVTQEEIEQYKTSPTPELIQKRKGAKVTNYSCLPVDNTEVLTFYGWRKFHNIRIGDTVLTYGGKRGLEWGKVLSTVEKYDDVISMSNGWVTLESTSDHRWISKRRTGKNSTRCYVEEYRTTEEISTEDNILTTACFDPGYSSVDITVDEAAIIGWILSDGYLSWSGKTRNNDMGVRASISQSKKKYYTELKDLLTRTGYLRAEYSTKTCEVFDLDKDKIRDLADRAGFYGVNKHDYDWLLFMTDLDKERLEAFFEAFKMADGHVTRGVTTISQNRGKINDAIQLCGYLLGYSVWGDNAKCQTIRFNERQTISGQKLKKENLGERRVFCLTTQQGNFIIRQNGKITITGNCTYGAYPPKIAKTAGIPLKDAEILHEAYWKRNWAIKEVVDALYIKEANGEQWLKNPVNGFYYNLRSDKDKFSTLNQGTGSYCFDVWLGFVLEERPQLTAQFHDEGVWVVKKGYRKEMTELLETSIAKANDFLKLNVKLGIGIQFGDNYGEVH